MLKFKKKKSKRKDCKGFRKEAQRILASQASIAIIKIT